MAIRTVVKIQDLILREISKPIKDFDERLFQLLDDMAETMHYEQGVGIAAVQVGVLRRACLICPDGKKLYELINPQIIEMKGEQVSEEGCLSIPATRQEVKRPNYIKVKAQDRHKKEFEIEAEGYLAVIFCHEIDHLDGILFIDKAE